MSRHKTLADAARAAAEIDNDDLAFGPIYDFCGIDDGAFGFDLVEGLRVNGDTTWAKLTKDERISEITQAAAIEVEAMVSNASGLGDVASIALAAASGSRYSVAMALAADITDRASGEAWLRNLHASNLEFHLEDDVSDIVEVGTGRRTFPDGCVEVIRDRVRKLYALDWGSFACPIGFLISLDHEEPQQ